MIYEEKLLDYEEDSDKVVDGITAAKVVDHGGQATP
jgi:hypothetical protein